MDERKLRTYALDERKLMTYALFKTHVQKEMYLSVIKNVDVRKCFKLALILFRWIRVSNTLVYNFCLFVVQPKS